MPTASILLVDDEAKILQSLGSALRTEGYEVSTAPGAGFCVLLRVPCVPNPPHASAPQRYSSEVAVP